MSSFLLSTMRAVILVARASWPDKNYYCKSFPVIPEHLKHFLSSLLLVLSSESLHFTQPRSFALNHSTGMWHWLNSFSYSLLKKLLGILWKCTKCWPVNYVFLSFSHPTMSLRPYKRCATTTALSCLVALLQQRCGPAKGGTSIPAVSRKKTEKKTLNQVLPAGLTILM